MQRQEIFVRIVVGSLAKLSCAAIGEVENIHSELGVLADDSPSHSVKVIPGFLLLLIGGKVVLQKTIKLNILGNY